MLTDVVVGVTKFVKVILEVLEVVVVKMIVVGVKKSMKVVLEMMKVLVVVLEAVELEILI